MSSAPGDASSQAITASIANLNSYFTVWYAAQQTETDPTVTVTGFTYASNFEIQWDSDVFTLVSGEQSTITQGANTVTVPLRQQINRWTMRIGAGGTYVRTAAGVGAEADIITVGEPTIGTVVSALSTAIASDTTITTISEGVDDIDQKTDFLVGNRLGNKGTRPYSAAATYPTNP